MTSEKQIVISASRRTDIPAFYMEWFMKRITKGFFEVTNPYNQKKIIVDASPEKVHTIVFWSKNFGPFIEKKYGDLLVKKGFNIFFNFTVNSEDSHLEPNVPPLTVRLQQMVMLGKAFGGEKIVWRFDPICFYKKNNIQQDNLHDIDEIAETARQAGINTCITSFMDHYKKIKTRTAEQPGFEFVDPPLEEKRDILLSLAHKLSKKNIMLQTCCEKDVLDTLPVGSRITNSSCIDNRHLAELFGGTLSFKKDAGQRTKSGCGCMVSSDIGGYQAHPCYHNCLFCYANPTPNR